MRERDIVMCNREKYEIAANTWIDAIGGHE
jgi:hypothetical protein